MAEQDRVEMTDANPSWAPPEQPTSLDGLDATKHAVPPKIAAESVGVRHGTTDVRVEKAHARAFRQHAAACRAGCSASAILDPSVEFEVKNACPVGLSLLAAGNASFSAPLGGSRPESPLARALRDEMRRILDDPLTVGSVRRLGRLISPSIKALQAMARGVEDLMPPPPRMPGIGMSSYVGGMGPGSSDPDAPDLGESSPSSYGASYAYAPPVETYGSNSFREIAASFMKLIEKQRQPSPPSVDELVESIAKAKEANLDPKVVRRLEAALEKALGAEEVRTVSPTSVVVSEPAEPATMRACTTDDVPF